MFALRLIESGVHLLVALCDHHGLRRVNCYRCCVSGFPLRDPIHAHYMFAGRHGVAVSGSVAAVGCRGWEAVFIYRDTVGDGSGWTQTAVLQSSDYRDLVWLSNLWVS